MNVLEFGTYLAGPLVGKYLSDIGYNVTRVSRPHNSNGKKEENEYIKLFEHDLNLNKNSISLNLPKDSQKLNNILIQTDIVIENFGNGVSEKRGFDFESCRKINPNIIYISIPGYARNDSNYSDVKAWDAIIMASSGVFCDMGLNRKLLGVKASYSSLPLPSIYGSIFGFFVLLCAIRANRKGEYFEVPLASSLMEALVHNSMEFPLNECYMSSRKKQIINNEYPISNEKLDELFDPFFRKYFCKDGRPFYLVCPAHIEHHRRVLKILEIEDEIFEIIQPVNVYSKKFIYGLGCGNIHKDHAKFIYPIMKAAFLKRNANDWEEVFGKECVPAISHKTKNEWINTNHAKESGLISKNSCGKINVGALGWFHFTNQVEKQPVANYLEKCLSGIKVLDLTNVIAGPTAGAMFSRMGADVLKIDPPKPFYAPDISVIYGIPSNIGKKSLLLDIKCDKGRKVLDALIKEYDILLINCTKKSLNRLKLSEAELKKINPSIILVHFDAWSGPKERGEYSEYIGYDDNVQAGIGIMSRFGGSLQDSEEHAHVGTIDVIAGVACAAFAVHAITCREKQGLVSTVRTSLVSVGQYVQYPLMFQENNTIGKGTKCRGEHPFYSCYETNDCWVFLAKFPSDTECLTITEKQEKYLSICNILKTKSFEEALECFDDKRITFQKLETMETIRKKNVVDSFCRNGKTYQFLVHYDHPVGVLTMVAPVATRVHIPVLNHSPKYGKDTKIILKKYKFENYTLDRCVSCSWSRFYIPYSVPCEMCHKSGLKLFTLSCGHKMCFYCMGVVENKCSVCGLEHETSIEKLDYILKNWKAGYKQWRRGLKKGSADMENLFTPEIS